MILLGGWILMLPPSKGDAVNSGEPLSKWEHLDSYDTAGDCIDDRNRRWASVWKRWGEDNVIARQYLEARCVPAEPVAAPQPPAQK
jgi:hypothetical protein